MFNTNANDLWKMVYLIMTSAMLLVSHDLTIIDSLVGHCIELYPIYPSMLPCLVVIFVSSQGCLMMQHLCAEVD